MRCALLTAKDVIERYVHRIGRIGVAITLVMPQNKGMEVTRAGRIAAAGIVAQVTA